LSHLVVGASAGLGRALAEGCASAGHSLVLVASDGRDLEAGAQDLRIRHGADVATVAADAGEPAAFAERVAEAVAARDLSAVLLPLGATSPDDDFDSGDPGERLLRINFLAPTALLARLLPQLRRQPAVTVVGFGSVAAARGRGRNVFYSAAKRALASYFESLRHACAGSRVRVQFYVLGYLDTQQAFGQRTLLPRADVGRLSSRVLTDLGCDFGVRYHPVYWRPVCAALRMLPWPAFRRLRF
jgi:short-subunit dehydrogenase